MKKRFFLLFVFCALILSAGCPQAEAAMDLSDYLLDGSWNIEMTVTDMPLSDNFFGGEVGMAYELRAEFLQIMTTLENDDIRTGLLKTLWGYLPDDVDESIPDIADYIKDKLPFAYQEAIANNFPTIYGYVLDEKWTDLTALLVSYSGDAVGAVELVGILKSEYDDLDTLIKFGVKLLLGKYDNPKYTDDFKAIFQFVFANPDSLAGMIALNDDIWFGSLATLKTYQGTLVGTGEGYMEIATTETDAGDESIAEIAAEYAFSANGGAIVGWTAFAAGIANPDYDDVPYWRSAVQRNIDFAEVSMRLHQTGPDSFKLVVATADDLNIKTEIYKASRNVAECRLDGEWEVTAVVYEKELPPAPAGMFDMLPDEEREALYEALSNVSKDVRAVIFGALADEVDSGDLKAITNSIADVMKEKAAQDILKGIQSGIDAIKTALDAAKRVFKWELSAENWDSLWRGFKVPLVGTLSIESALSSLLDTLGLKDTPQKDSILELLSVYENFDYFWTNIGEIFNLIGALMESPTALSMIGNMEPEALKALGGDLDKVFAPEPEEMEDVVVAEGDALLTIFSELSDGKELLASVGVDGMAHHVTGGAIELLWDTLGAIVSADYRYPNDAFLAVIEIGSSLATVSRDARIEIKQAAADKIQLKLIYVEPAPVVEDEDPQQDAEPVLDKQITHIYNGTLKVEEIVVPGPDISDDEKEKEIDGEDGGKTDGTDGINNPNSSGGGGGGGCNAGMIPLLLLAAVPFFRKRQDAAKKEK